MTKNKNQKYTMFIIGIFCLSIVGCTPKTMEIIPVISKPSLEQINIQLPDIIENGDVTPFFANFSPNLTNGDIALVFLGDNQLAYAIEIEGNIEIAQFSGRIRNRFGNIKVVVKHRNTIISEKTTLINGNIYNKLPNEANQKPDCQARGKDKQVKILCQNNMASNGYINNIKIKLPNGKVKIDLTPNASMNPYMGLIGSFDGTSAKIYSSIATVPFIEKPSVSSSLANKKKELSFNGNSKQPSTSITYTCSNLSKREAYNLLSQGHSYLDRDNDGHPCEWKPNTIYKRSYTPKKSNCHRVKGHYRKGKYVRGYTRCR